MIRSRMRKLTIIDGVQVRSRKNETQGTKQQLDKWVTQSVVQFGHQILLHHGTNITKFVCKLKTTTYSDKLLSVQNRFLQKITII